MDERFLTPTELRNIADACETLQPLWELLTAGPSDIYFTDEAWTTSIDCYDSKGDKIGYISWGESGPVFYLDPLEK